MHSMQVLVALASCLLVTAAPHPRPPRLPFSFPPRQENGSTGAATCDLSSVSQPSITPALPAPSAGLSLILIAQGSGTQNYTCADSTASSTPAAIGAFATLVNASCEVANNQLGGINEDAAAIGMHFFVDTTTPDFDIIGLGNTELKKVNSSAAPAAADGTANVPWLKLEAQAEGTTSSVKEIYRLVTEGGVAPANCDGQASLVQVDYKAQYWFYASTEEIASRRRNALGMA